MMNMMWATTTVTIPSGNFMFKNSASRLAPITTSGVAIGRKISRFVVDRPRKRCRTRANEIIVPRTVAISVEMMPIWMLVTKEEHTPGTPHRFDQASVENWFQDRLNLPTGLLNDRTAMTAIGMNR